MGKAGMAKKNLSVELPEYLTISLGKVAKRTGRKKTLLVGASLLKFLEAGEGEQEEIIRKYLDTSKD
jgi:predicted transcriptional regulator